MDPFWTDQTVIGDVEQHIKALLDHVNVYTGVAYKDDPTILGWDLLNGGGSPTPWTRQIASYVRSLDRHHLILSGAVNADLAAVDACVSFVYPHWSLPFDFVQGWIDACRAAGKPYIVYEYGWDSTNFPTQPSLSGFLAKLRADPLIAGDAFWALEAHADGHGWMPIPADTADSTVARTGESGQWWAMYYTGVTTLVMSAGDMAARAQIVRSHNYAMDGVRRPRHAIPPAPVVTSIVPLGSAGARAVRPGGVRADRLRARACAEARHPDHPDDRGRRRRRRRHGLRLPALARPRPARLLDHRHARLLDGPDRDRRP